MAGPASLSDLIKAVFSRAFGMNKEDGGGEEGEGKGEVERSRLLIKRDVVLTLHRQTRIGRMFAIVLVLVNRDQPSFIATAFMDQRSTFEDKHHHVLCQKSERKCHNCSYPGETSVKYAFKMALGYT